MVSYMHYIHFYICHSEILLMFIFSLNIQAYMITTVFPIILYAYETWSVTLREEYMLTVFKNYRVLGIIFGPSKEEMTGDWRKLHIKELPNITSCQIK